MPYFTKILLGTAILFMQLTFSAEAYQTGVLSERSAWETLSEKEKKEIISEWVQLSAQRLIWSHKARKDFAYSSYNQASLLGMKDLRMRAMFSLAELYFNEAKFDLALAYFDSLSVYADETNNYDLKIRSDNYIGSVLRYRGDAYEALGLVHNARDMALNKKDFALVSLSGNNLGILYRHLGENKLAISYFQEALEMAQLSGDTLQMIIANTGIGNFHWFEKEITLARDFYLRAMELAKASKDMQYIASLHNNLGNTYRERDDFDNALYHYDTAYKMLDEIMVVGLKAVVLRNKGIVYMRLGMYDRALDFTHRSLELSQQMEIKTFMRDNFMVLSQLYNATGNVNLAYENLRRYTELNQQIHSAQLLNRISYFNEKVQDARRMEEVYKFRLERNLLIMAIIGLILVFLGFFSVLIFNRFRERRGHITRLKNTLQDKIITEKALRQSEENYQNLIKTLNEGLMVLDQENRIEFVNAKACKVFAVNDKKELIGKRFEEFLLTSDDVKLFREKVELQKMGISDHYEIKVKNFSGDLMWANLSSSPILDENLKAKGSVALISDITEKKKSEQSYNELTFDLNQKIKQINCLYDITDISGVPGITFEEIIQKSLEIIPVGLKYSHDIGVQIAFADKTYSSENYKDTPWSYSVPIKVQKKKLGYIKVGYLQEKPLINKDPFHFNEKILLKNISEKFGQIIESKNLENILRDNQEKLKEVQRIAKIGNWEKNLITGECQFSDTFFDIAGITPEKRLFFDYGRLGELIHPEDRDIFKRFEERLINDKEKNGVTADYRIQTHDGAVKYVFSIGKLIVNEENEKTSMVFTVQDITEQKYSQELQHQAELALKTSEAKQQVLANMNYEMRNPITGIMGLVDFLLQSDLSEKQFELARNIKDSGVVLLNTINNILDLQRIEEGKLEISNAAFKPRHLVEKIAGLFSSVAREKNIKLKTKVDSKLSETLVSDESRLYQVVTSLLSVLAEDPSAGDISIDLKAGRKNKPDQELIVKISNQSNTLDINKVNNVFGPSQSEVDYLLHKRDNISLGLAISKKLIDLLNGEISIEQNKKGTIFTLIFPTAEYDEKSDILKEDNQSLKIFDDLKGVKVLCVEDQRVNQKVISMMLDHVKCEVEIAGNGKEALALLEENSYDIMLLDMVMPVMDGLETLKKMDAKLEKRPPVIALSANVMDQDKKRYFEAGIDDFIGKPIDSEELYGKILHWHKHSNRGKTERKTKSRNKSIKG